MKKLSVKLLCLLLTVCILAGCAPTPAPETPVAEEDMTLVEVDGAEYSASGEYTTVLYCEDMDFSHVGKNGTSVKYTYEGTEYAAAVREVTVIDQHTVQVSFVNEDAARRKVFEYAISLDNPECTVYMFVELPPVNATANVEWVSAYDNSFRITLSLEEGVYASDISEEMITLSGSFEGFSLESMSASGANLTLGISGQMEKNAAAGFYVDGIIDVASEAFAEQVQGMSVRIPVVSESMRFLPESLRLDGNIATVELAVYDSSYLADLTAADIAFEEGVTVTAMEKGEGKLTLSLSVEGADTVNAVAALLDRQLVTLGDLTITADFSGAGFYPVFDYVEENGKNLDFTLILHASGGHFNTLTAASVTLGGAFAEGAVASVTRTGDYTAELKISVPAEGQTVESLHMEGTVSLAAGAMQNRWGVYADAVAHTRSYTQDSMGKDSFDDWFKLFAGADYDFTNVTIVSGESTVKTYFKKVVGVFQSETFGTILTVASGVASAATGIYTLLQVLGVVDSPMSQINAAISLMQEEFAAINSKLDALTRQNYYDTIDDFYMLLGQLGQCQAAMQNRTITIGRIYGIPYPKEPDSKTMTEEELAIYNEALDAYYKQVIPLLMEMEPDLFYKLRENYMKVTSYFVSRSKSIFETYDELMSIMYAFDSEAYEDRDNFRTLTMIQLVRAVATMGLYYKYYYSEPILSDYEREILKPYDAICAELEESALEAADDKIYCYVTNAYYNRQMVIQGVSHFMYGHYYAVMDPSQTSLATDNRKNNVKADVSYVAQLYDDKITVDGKAIEKFEVGDTFVGKVIKVKRGEDVHTYSFGAVTLTDYPKKMADVKGKNISKANAKELVTRFKTHYGSKMNMLTVLNQIGFVIPTNTKVGNKYDRSIVGIVYRVNSYSTVVNYLTPSGSIVTEKDVWGYSYKSRSYGGIALTYKKCSKMVVSFLGA